jgi:hypothetical protein
MTGILEKVRIKKEEAQQEEFALVKMSKSSEESEHTDNKPNQYSFTTYLFAFGVAVGGFMLGVMLFLQYE